MNSKHFLPLVTGAFLLAAVAADNPNTSGVIHLDHAKVADMFSRGGTLLATNNFKVMALRRDLPGEVEIHDRDTDIIYVLDGSATFITGGSAMGPRSTGPDEARAKNIEGGEERNLMKGDVIIVPNHVPHWFKAVNPPFLYYVVKVAR